MIVVHSWGVAGSIRDAGRVGRAAWGAPRGGAVDSWSLALANRLVGNAEDAAAFESSGGLDIEVVGAAALVAVTGAQADMVVRDGPPLGWGSPQALPQGARLRIGRLRAGARVYLGVRGGLTSGIDGQPEARSGMRSGAVIFVGDDPGTEVAGIAASPLPTPDRLTIWPGPRCDWFDRTAWQELCAADFVVSPASDRVGVRLSGPLLQRVVHHELPSEGVVEGAVQVPSDGHPIVMLADHPTTGGYPVIAVVDPRHVHHIAQLAPGDVVRFKAASQPSGGGSVSPR
jgi:biotin-dependent carboxylase-like uncharacterized protein